MERLPATDWHTCMHLRCLRRVEAVDLYLLCRMRDLQNIHANNVYRASSNCKQQVAGPDAPRKSPLSIFYTRPRQLYGFQLIRRDRASRGYTGICGSIQTFYLYCGLPFDIGMRI
jgi:hypothetical protein